MRLLAALVALVVLVYFAMQFAGRWAFESVVDEALHAEPIEFPTPSFPTWDLKSFEPWLPTFRLRDDSTIVIQAP
jgi:hypothetical protein